jgi:flagellar biosynthetic protein FlhB
MAEEHAQERTEEATPKRLREAREKGQVARSRELNTVMTLMAAAIGAFILGKQVINSLQGLIITGFSIDRTAAFDSQLLPGILMNTILDALWIITPVMILLFFAALLGPLSLGGWAFSTEAIQFKWDKLDVIKGLGRIFSLKGLMELFKTLAKFVVVTSAAAVLLWIDSGSLMQLGAESVHVALSETGTLLLWGFLALTGVLLLIAAIDVPFQIWEHSRQLKMTRQEVKDEMKETEGNPEVKAKTRSVQREMARQRMMAEVPKADVVITNPTHYAVALKYDPELGGAPRMVAKGVDLVAGEIRKLANETHVPIYEAPPLARAIYYNTRLNQEVPAALYVAVAQVLAYVFQLREFRKGGAYPQPPGDLNVPEEMTRPKNANNEERS